MIVVVFRIHVNPQADLEELGVVSIDRCFICSTCFSIVSDWVLRPTIEIATPRGYSR